MRNTYAKTYRSTAEAFPGCYEYGCAITYYSKRGSWVIPACLGIAALASLSAVLVG